MGRTGPQGLDARIRLLQQLAACPQGLPERASFSKAAWEPSLVSQLVREGLVTRRPPQGRERLPRLLLTESGRQELERAQPGGATSPAPDRSAQAAGGFSAPAPADRKASAARPTLAGLARELSAMGRQLQDLADGLKAVGARMDTLEQVVTARLQALEQRVGMDGAREGAGPEEPEPALAGLHPATSRPPGQASPARTVWSVETFQERLRRAFEEIDVQQGRLGRVAIPRLREALGGEVGSADFDRLLLQLAARRTVILVPHDHPGALTQAQRAGALRDDLLGHIYYWVRWKG